MEMCIYCFYDNYFPLFATCVFSCIHCLLLAEWREHDKGSNIVSDSDKISVTEKKNMFTHAKPCMCARKSSNCAHN